MAKNLTAKNDSIKKYDNENELKQINFIKRESLLTELFNDKNIVAIWAIFFSFGSIAVYQALLGDYTFKGR